MKCIDFDRYFSDFTSQWVKENAGKYRSADEMEAHFPDVYLKWLNTPADWLGRVSPAMYFGQFDDAKMLVHWMRDYFKQGVDVPDLLLERIVELGGRAAQELMILLQKPSHDEDEAKLCAVGLLSEMQSEIGFDLYISWLETSQEHDDLAERVCDALAQNCQPYRDKLLAAYERATPAGKARLLDVMAYLSGDEQVYQILKERFLAGDNRALIASYLLKNGNEQAVELLKKALDLPETGYLDYIEIRNAIEGLGGLVESERDFTGDKDYEALRQV